MFAIALPMPPGIPPGIIPDCSSSLMVSLSGLADTPPPVSAGECRGRTEPIFQPRGAGGAGCGSLGTGKPAMRRRKGEVSVVGFCCR